MTKEEYQAYLDILVGKVDYHDNQKKYFDNKANELRKKWGQLEDSGLLLGAPINDIILTKKQEMKNEIESDIDYK